VTTHIWGKAKVDITYYPADVKDFLSDHSARIRCVVGGRNIQLHVKLPKEGFHVDIRMKNGVPLPDHLSAFVVDTASPK
jgi:hypothetical protein